MAAKQHAAAAIGATTSANSRATGNEVHRALRSYGVWAPHAVPSGDKKRFWRASTQGGYAADPLPMERQTTLAALGSSADMLVVDDGALAFRHGSDLSALDIQAPGPSCTTGAMGM